MLVAGPSHAIYTNYIGGASNLNSRAQNSSSSVITVSSTSSPSNPSTSSNKYNLFKSVTSSIKSGTDLIKNTLFSKISNSIAPSTSKNNAIASDLSSNNQSKNSLLVKLDKKYLSKSNSPAGNNSSDESEDEDSDSLKAELIYFKPIAPISKTVSPLSNTKIMKILSVRPETSSVENCFSPCASPFDPIDPKVPRKSAFSIVTIQEERENIEISQSDDESKAVTLPKRGRKRKTEKTKPEIHPSPPPPASKKSKRQKAVASPVPARVTRSRKSDENSKLAEQEKKDLEFAKKLDEKLNGKLTTRNQKQKQQQVTESKATSKANPTIEVKTYNTRNRKK